MTLDTTLARLVAVVRSVDDVGHVHENPRIGIDRDDAEAQYLVGAGDNRRPQAWEIHSTPEVVHDGCGGLHRTELKVKIVGWWYVDDETGSREEFAKRGRAVSLALVDSASGFPQLGAPGLPFVIDESPRQLRTGHAAWRGTLTFRLTDTDST